MRYREYRWPCDFPVLVERPSGTIPARLRNVSHWGARLTAHTAFAPAERVRLRLGSLFPPLQAGLRFERALTAKELTLIRKTSGTRSLRVIARPNLRELS